jgi:hypothetical protein
LPCRRERRSSCTAPSTSEPCRIYRWNRECWKLRKRCRCGGSRPAHVPPVSRPVTAIGGLAALAVHFRGTGGVVLLFENVGELGRAGGSSRPRRPAACGLLFLARWIRLPRRHMGSRRRVRPDRLRHPRGLRGAAEAQQPREEMGAMLLKHQQDGFGGRASCICM